MLARKILVLSISAIVLLTSSAASSPQCPLEQFEEWISPAPNSSDQFGVRVALAGDWAAVGNPVNDLSLPAQVHVFRRSGGSWSPWQILQSPTAFGADGFGYWVTFDGDDLYISDRYDNQQGADRGAVHVFERNSTTDMWIWKAKLLASDATFSTRPFLGESMAAAGGIVVAGAVGADNSCGGIGQECGASYVFVKPASGWNGTHFETCRLVSSAVVDNAQLGAAVAIRDGLIAVAAIFDNGVVATRAGKVYVYTEPIGGWSSASGTTLTESCTLLAAGGQMEDHFGQDLQVGADRVVVGAAYAENSSGPQDTGAVYVFDKPTGGWTGSLQEPPTLVPSSLRTTDGFGHGLALQGDRLMVAARLHAQPCIATQAGQVYGFEYNGAIWEEKYWLRAIDPQPTDTFGFSVALDGDLVLVGDIVDDHSGKVDAGSAKLFDLSSCYAQLHGFCAIGVCGNPDGGAGCVNETGMGSLLLPAGSASVAADDLLLTASCVPPQQFGIVFMGGAQKQPPTPLGNGLLAVAPGALGIFRYPVQFSGAGNTINIGPGIVALSQAFPGPGPIQPGDVRQFQAWYRDPGGPCGHSSNLSNAVEITFEP